MKQGQPISEWITNPEMAKQEITTARVMLITGVVLGGFIGAGISYLIFA